MREIHIEDLTLRRLNSLNEDLMARRQKNIELDELINELIDNYQQNAWDQEMASGG